MKYDYLVNDRCLPVRVGAMEEEAIGCDEVYAEDKVLGVSPAARAGLRVKSAPLTRQPAGYKAFFCQKIRPAQPANK